MPVSAVSKTSVSARIEALRAKHDALSKKVEEAQKDLSTTDFHLSKLKKEKLIIKEKLASEEKRIAG